MSDQFAMYDAPYLLGALTPADRAEYEAHLTECVDCRRAVNALAGLPGLLASVSAERVLSLGEPEPEVPETLLPRLMHEVQRTRFRRRVSTTLLGVAAAAILAIALIAGLRSSPTDDTQQAGGTPPGELRMTPVSKNVPIRATAWLDEKAWGTRIEVRCVYTAPPDHYPSGSTGLTYTMVVTDNSGATQQVAAWEARPGAPIVVDGATSVSRSQISSVQVRGPEDKPILTLRL